MSEVCSLSLLQSFLIPSNVTPKTGVSFEGGPVHLTFAHQSRWKCKECCGINVDPNGPFIAVHRSHIKQVSCATFNSVAEPLMSV